MLNDEKLRELMVEGGHRTLSEHFCVDKMVEETLAVYRRLLDQ